MRALGALLISSPLIAVTILAAITHGWVGFLGCMIGLAIVAIILVTTISGAALVSGYRWSDWRKLLGADE